MKIKVAGFSVRFYLLRCATAIILCLLLSVSHADEQSGARDSTVTEGTDRKTVEGEALWIEEKINPATRWIEEQVRPLTKWIEDKIQNHEEIPPSPQPDWKTTQPHPLINELSPQSSERNGTSVISPEHAVDIVTKAYPGDVLRVKYLSRDTPVYRVKIISKKGEIYILYVNAWTGEVLN